MIVLSIAAALGASTPAWAQQDPHARQEIAHLQDKYEYLQRRSLVPTTQAFIERAASESSFSHKAYQVRCGNAQPIASAQWLNGELARYRAAQK